MWDTLRSTGRSRMVDPARALPGRDAPAFDVPSRHEVLGTPLTGPWPDGIAVLYVGMGCFWGAEKLFWRLPGVHSTAVGYQGGPTPNPTYEEVCTGRTGHAEVVLVAYDPATLPTYEVLRAFWETHDPTQGYRQGNDVGTQYRSAAYWTTDEQRDLLGLTAGSFGAELTRRGLGDVTTEIAPASAHPFWYDCHAETGVRLPPLAG